MLPVRYYLQNNNQPIFSNPFDWLHPNLLDFRKCRFYWFLHYLCLSIPETKGVEEPVLCSSLVFISYIRTYSVYIPIIRFPVMSSSINKNHISGIQKCCAILFPWIELTRIYRRSRGTSLSSDGPSEEEHETHNAIKEHNKSTLNLINFLIINFVKLCNL